MSVPFATRPPTPDETQRVRLAMSTFRDGSGMLKEGAATLPGWRDFERVFAATLGGEAAENKGIFDVIVPSTARPEFDYGFSIKSKQLSRARMDNLDTSGRVYMELANSTAAFWAALNKKHITEEDFKAGRHPQEIGDTLLEVVNAWHCGARDGHARDSTRKLDLKKSVYLTVSYSMPRRGLSRIYQLHSFRLKFPNGITWRYATAKCLRGDDPGHQGEPLFDWFALAGGQLKYYPRAASALFRSDPFELVPVPETLSIVGKAAAYWPKEWVSAGGKVPQPPTTDPGA